MSAPLAVRSRRAIDAIVADLRAAYGTFPVSTETVENDPEFFEEGREGFERGMRGGAGVRATDDAGRVLCIREAREPDRWVLPAGGHEPGEDVQTTARREAREEAGVAVALTDVWAAKRRRFVRRDDPESRGYLLAVFFAAEPVADTTPDPDPSDWEADEEILEAAWIDPQRVDRDVLPLATDRTASVP